MVSLRTSIVAHILFCQTADNTMQRGNFATKMCEIVTKFLVSRAKLLLDIFWLLSSPDRDNEIILINQTELEPSFLVGV